MYVQSTKLLSDFQAIVGCDHATESEAARTHHSKDESHFAVKHLPQIVLFPGCTGEVQECVKICSHNSIPIIPFGTGTGMEGGVMALKNTSVCIDLSRMDQVTHLSVEDFTVSVQPGITRKSLNHHIKDTGLWFPIDPGADASVCGMAATSASGTNAVKYGTMRENVINLEVVLPDGQLLHTAGKGSRPRKTSAGYNLTNLFVGSEGTLGIITETTLKLYGSPEATVSAVCQFPSIEAAVDATVAVLQSGISVGRIELLDEISIGAANKYSDLSYKIAPTLFLEFQGSQAYITSQVEATEEVAALYGGSEFSWAERQEDRNRLWTARHNMLYALKALRPSSHVLSTDIAVPLSSLSKIIVEMQTQLQNCGLSGGIIGHVGDGNFHTLIHYDSEEEFERVSQMVEQVTRMAIAMGGTCTGEHGIGMGKRLFLEEEVGETALTLMRQLKTTIDPKGIMNPGKVLFP